MKILARYALMPEFFMGVWRMNLVAVCWWEMMVSVMPFLVCPTRVSVYATATLRIKPCRVRFS